MGGIADRRHHPLYPPSFSEHSCQCKSWAQNSLNLSFSNKLFSSLATGGRFSSFIGTLFKKEINSLCHSKKTGINFLSKNIRSLMLTISNLKLLKFKSTSYFLCSFCLSLSSVFLSPSWCVGGYMCCGIESTWTYYTHMKQPEKHYGCHSLGTFCFKTRGLSLTMSARTDKNTTNFLTTS